MILITLLYSAKHHADNNRTALQSAELHGWRLDNEEIRPAEPLGPEVLQTLSFVPINGGRVAACPPDLMISISSMAKGQWGKIFEVRTVNA